KTVRLIEITDNPRDDSRCLWCGRRFEPRGDGGKEQRFCSPACRRALDAAGRRFVAEAIACGLLSLDQIRKGVAATRALLPGGNSPARIHEEPRKPTPAPVAPPACVVEYGGRCWRLDGHKLIELAPETATIEPREDPTNRSAR